MKLSIIIVNYNTKELLKKCLESIRKSEITKLRNYEIIVVDNGSKEKIKYQIVNIKNTLNQSKLGSGQAYKNLKIKLIENKENLGFGRANNQGVKEAEGEYILFLNTDIEVLDKSIETLLEFLKRNIEVNVVGGKLYNKDMTAQASCGPFYSLPVTFVMLFLKGDKLGLTRWSPQKTKEVDWVSGACFLMRKKDYQELGGFDERVFMYMEEVELLYRAKNKGMRVFFNPKGEFVHLGAATSKKMGLNSILNIYGGLLYFYKKHKKRWEFVLLTIMLKTKAVLSYLMGLLTNNSYLKETYAQAYKLACQV